MELIICEKCGKQFNERVKFCPGCGALIDDGEEEISAADLLRPSRNTDSRKKGPAVPQFRGTAAGSVQSMGVVKKPAAPAAPSRAAEEQIPAAPQPAVQATVQAEQEIPAPAPAQAAPEPERPAGIAASEAGAGVVEIVKKFDRVYLFWGIVSLAQLLAPIISIIGQVIKGDFSWAEMLVCTLGIWMTVDIYFSELRKKEYKKDIRGLFDAEKFGKDAISRYIRSGICGTCVAFSYYWWTWLFVQAPIIGVLIFDILARKDLIKKKDLFN